MASSDKLGRTIANSIPGTVFQVARTHTSLGTGLTSQLRRRTGVPQKRFRASALRRKRLLRLRKAGAKIGQVLRAGPAGVALWGATSGVAPGRLHALRQQQLRAEEKLPSRTRPELYWLVHKPKADPAAIHHQQLLGAYAKVVAGGFFTDEELGDTFAWASGRLRTALSPWGRCVGPAHALLLTAVRL
eukprot:3055363-Amphidinium_carterae.1